MISLGSSRLELVVTGKESSRCLSLKLDRAVPNVTRGVLGVLIVRVRQVELQRGLRCLNRLIC